MDEAALVVDLMYPCSRFSGLDEDSRFSGLDEDIPVPTSHILYREVCSNGRG